MTRLPLAPVLAPALVAVLALTGCSSSDDDTSSTPASSSADAGAGADVEADAAVDDTPDTADTADSAEADAEAAEALDDFDEALDDASGDLLTDALGQALVSVLPEATAYELVDGRLVVDMDGSSSAGEDDCVIASAARTGVGYTKPLDLRYDDGTAACG